MIRLGLLLLLSFPALASLDGSPRETCESDICFAVSRDGLHLSGVATGQYLGFIDLYVAALYLPSKTALVLDDDTSKRLEIGYLRNFSNAQLITAAEATLERQVLVEKWNRLKPQIEQIHALYRDVSPRDRVVLEYDATVKRLSLFFNDDLLGTFAGADFSQAYLGIWLGEDPLSEKVKTRLLSQ